ncbi:hypothetical protein BYT27DRAFT_7255376 [Phlegmacium glaucopus]|nr:hypothetical protein BYT27DRAFT_7255376 [Phlegmacium glaucopus]
MEGEVEREAQVEGEVEREAQGEAEVEREAQAEAEGEVEREAQAEGEAQVEVEMEGEAEVEIEQVDMDMDEVEIEQVDMDMDEVEIEQVDIDMDEIEGKSEEGDVYMDDIAGKIEKVEMETEAGTGAEISPSLEERGHADIIMKNSSENKPASEGDIPSKIKRKRTTEVEPSVPSLPSSSSSAIKGKVPVSEKPTPSHLKVKEEEDKIIQYVGAPLVITYHMAKDHQTSWPEVQVKNDLGTQRLIGKPMECQVPGLSNQRMKYIPQAHLASDIFWLCKVRDQAAIHPSLPPSLYITERNLWERLPESQKQNIFSQNDVLIQDKGFNTGDFDKHLLLSITNSMARITLCQISSKEQLQVTWRPSSPTPSSATIKPT